MTNTTDLNSKIAGLESKVDYLEAELGYVNLLLLKCGFPEGIKTLKKTVEDLLSESPFDIDEDETQVL
jgi:hypothetical protein